MKPLYWLKDKGKKHWPWVMVGGLIYLLAKAYVAYTPDPNDDDIPDKIKDAVLLMVYDAPEFTKPDNSCVSEEECDKVDSTSYA